MNELSQIELVWVRVLCKMAESNIAEFKMVAFHQGKSGRISVSQIELVWVRVLCKMAQSKMAEFKMAAIIKLNDNEWVWVRLN